MTNYPTQTRKGMLRLLALVCFTLGLALPAAAQCKKVELPDLDTLNLSDGEHTIKAVNLRKGKLEVRVKVKGKVVSDPILYFRGKPMKSTPESELSKPVRDCLQKAEAPSGSRFGNAARFILGRIAPTAYAAPFRTCKQLYTYEDDFMVCATLCCTDGSCHHACVFV